MDYHKNRADKWCYISHTQTVFFNAEENQNLALINNGSALNAHTDIVDNLSLIEVAEPFANAKERRRNEFRTFTEKDLH